MNDLLWPASLLAGIIGVAVVLTAGLRTTRRKRELLHRERMAAIEKRLDVPAGMFADVPSPDACLLRGMVWLFAGIGTFVFFLAVGVSQGDRELFGAATVGLVPVGIGIAYLIMSRKVRGRS